MSELASGPARTRGSGPRRTACRRGPALALAVVALALAGCSSGGDRATAPAPTSTTSTPRATCETEYVGVSLAVEAYTRTYGGPPETIGQLEQAEQLPADYSDRWSIVDSHPVPTGGCR